MKEQQLTHWKVTVDGSGIATATLDKNGASANTLSREVMEELSSIISQAEVSPPSALIFRSGKDAGFIAGAY